MKDALFCDGGGASVSGEVTDPSLGVMTPLSLLFLSGDFLVELCIEAMAGAMAGSASKTGVVADVSMDFSSSSNCFSSICSLITLSSLTTDMRCLSESTGLAWGLVTLASLICSGLLLPAAAGGGAASDTLFSLEARP